MAVARHFHTGADGATGTTANSGADQLVQTGGAATIETDAPLIGSHPGMLMVGSAASGLLMYNFNLSSTAIGFDYVFTLNSTISAEATQVYISNGAGARCCAIALTSARKLQIRNTANAVIFGPGTAVLAASAPTTLVRLAGYVTIAGVVKVKMFTGTSMTTLSEVENVSLTGQSVGAGSYNNIRFGPKSATTTAVLTANSKGCSIDVAATDIPGVWTVAEDNTAPAVGVTANKTNVYPGETVAFTGTATDADGTIVDTDWATTAGTLVVVDDTHATITAGARVTDLPVTVTFSATDNFGTTVPATVGFTLKANQPPTFVVDQVAPNVVDLRDSTSGDLTSLTFPTPTEITSTGGTPIALDTGLWLFPDTVASSWTVSCTQGNGQNDSETVNVSARGTSGYLHGNAPKVPSGANPGTGWG